MGYKKAGSPNLGSDPSGIPHGSHTDPRIYCANLSPTPPQTPTAALSCCTRALLVHTVVPFSTMLCCLRFLLGPLHYCANLPPRQSTSCSTRFINPRHKPSTLQVELTSSHTLFNLNEYSSLLRKSVKGEQGRPAGVPLLVLAPQRGSSRSRLRCRRASPPPPLHLRRHVDAVLNPKL